MEDIIWNHLYEVLERFAEYFRNKAQENLMQGNHVAKGGLINSIETEIEINDSHFAVYCNLANYWKYVNDGTGPSHEPDARDKYFPPIGVIKEWIQVKGIMPEVRPVQLKSGKWVERMPSVKQLPYAIQRGIYKHGTRATHFFDMAKDDALEYFKESIELAIDEDMSEYIRQNLDELKGLLV